MPKSIIGNFQSIIDSGLIGILLNAETYTVWVVCCLLSCMQCICMYLQCTCVHVQFYGIIYHLCRLLTVLRYVCARTSEFTLKYCACNTYMTVTYTCMYSMKIYSTEISNFSNFWRSTKFYCLRNSLPYGSITLLKHVP